MAMITFSHPVIHDLFVTNGALDQAVKDEILTLEEG